MSTNTLAREAFAKEFALVILTAVRDTAGHRCSRPVMLQRLDFSVITWCAHTEGLAALRATVLPSSRGVQAHVFVTSALLLHTAKPSAVQPKV